MDDERDTVEFNDLETDERINIDIFKFDMAFPDPLNYCIGFISNAPSKKVVEEYKS